MFDLNASSPSLFVRLVMAPLTKALNPLVRRLAGRRHFGIVAQVHHTGRRSGREYVTPVGARLAGEFVLIPLTFGSRSDWSRNVRAAGGCTVVLRGTTYHATDPEYLTPAGARPMIRAAFSSIERAVFRILGIRQFLRLRIAASQPERLPARASSGATSLLATKRGKLLLLMLCGAQLLVVLDAAIVNVALPEIQHGLGFSQQDLQWVPSAYVLTFAGFLMLGGRAADLLGRRRVFMIGVAIFALTSFVAGLAQSEAVLIGARVAQGFGAALMSPAALSLITTTFRDGADRARAIGAYGAVSGAGGAIGVLLGGVLTSGPGWRWVFFVNVPLAILLLATVPRLIPGTREAITRKGLDLPGAILVTAGVTLLVWALIKAPDDGWGDPRIVAELVVSAALLILFVGNEALVARPLMPLRVVRLPGLAEANAVVLLAFGAVFALFFFLSLYVQEVLGYSALRAGMAFLPLALGIMLAAGATARMIERRGSRPAMLGGTLILTGGLLLLVRLPVHAHYVSDLLGPLLIVAAGAGSCLIACVMAANNGVGEQEAGLAAGLVNTFQRIGGGLALAVLSAVATARTRTLATTGHLDPAHALTGGFHRAFLVAAGFALAAFAVSAGTSLRRRSVPASNAHSPRVGHQTELSDNQTDSPGSGAVLP